MLILIIDKQINIRQSKENNFYKLLNYSYQKEIIFFLYKENLIHQLKSQKNLSSDLKYIAEFVFLSVTIVKNKKK